jgi:hypothetical protein
MAVCNRDLVAKSGGIKMEINTDIEARYAIAAIERDYLRLTILMWRSRRTEEWHGKSVTGGFDLILLDLCFRYGCFTVCRECGRRWTFDSDVTARGRMLIKYADWTGRGRLYRKALFARSVMVARVHGHSGTVRPAKRRARSACNNADQYGNIRINTIPTGFYVKEHEHSI